MVMGPSEISGMLACFLVCFFVCDMTSDLNCLFVDSSFGLLCQSDDPSI